MTSAATPEALVEASYVLLKRGLFERPGHHGYTGVLRHAGRFSHEEASAYAVHGGSVTMMLASEAPEYSPACWHETQVEDLLDLLRIEREAKDYALADLQRVTAERDEAREVVARCNNSFGSYSYHLNPHPAEQIEKVKWQARSEWQRAEAATAEAARLRAEVEALKGALEHVKAWIDTDLPAGTARAGIVHLVIVDVLNPIPLARAATAREG